MEERNNDTTKSNRNIHKRNEQMVGMVNNDNHIHTMANKNRQRHEKQNRTRTVRRPMGMKNEENETN